MHSPNLTRPNNQVKENEHEADTSQTQQHAGLPSAAGSPLGQRPPMRPQLHRSAPGPISETHPASSEDEQSSAQVGDSSSDDLTGGSSSNDGMRQAAGNSRPRPKTKHSYPMTEEERLLKMKDAINAKLLMHQQRKRNSYGTSSTTTPGAKRVSPIREEDSVISPSLNAAFSSPGDATSLPASTISTESADSAGTVRGGARLPLDEGNRPLRTPSYPFPRVGTPRSISTQALLNDFLAQSPSTSEMGTPKKSRSVFASGGSTPFTMHLAQDATSHPHEHPDFPTPNLYDLILQLNAEPGIEQWWATVSNIVHDNFKAERASLFVPLDPTDLENVPWGQKATFSMNGPEEFVSPQTLSEQTTKASTFNPATFLARTPSTSLKQDAHKQKLHPERLRPSLQSRHSYAGHGRATQDAVSKPQRPAGPKRVATHVPGMTAAEQARPEAIRFSSNSTIRHSSLTDPDYSSVGGSLEPRPHAEVFSSVRPFNKEVQSLIEVGGINRVLERGCLVTITRDYSSDNANDASTPVRTDEPGSDLAPRDTKESARTSEHPRSLASFPSGTWPTVKKDYEEYEQYPSSPWAQSPAPSPAIQSDEEMNPFFATEADSIEESFNPGHTPRDYSQLGQVEAIGVDRASTVIHIPLIHPTLSQPMQSLRTQETDNIPGPPRRSNTLDLDRKAPIAIISILSTSVPYPQNLSRVMDLLGPHLATSFAIAQQFASTHFQSVTIRHRRTASGHHITTAPMTVEPASLDDLVHADVERPHGSVSASTMTSPSEYSSKSKASPGGSLVGTPGWDMHVHFGNRSQANTPALTSSEVVDSYFDAKRTRVSQRKSSNPAHPPQSIPSRSLNANGQEQKLTTQKMSAVGTNDAANKRVDEPDPSDTHDCKQPRSMGQQPSSAEDASTAKSHSYLHSYGADFATSFGSIIGSNRPSTPGHNRKSSYPEDMPPPSERLLRTIIDSVPVQIFTAKPDSGQLSWVNSKFLIYRGQEPGQVLNEPWQAIHPDDRDEFLASWHRSLRTAQQLQQKVRLQRFDGTYRWFYVRAAPLKDRRQKIVHWIGTMMDFHEQHLAEQNAARQQETAASEAKYRALANSSPQIVFAVSRIRGVIFCNSQWVHYSGQQEEQALGMGFMDHVHVDDIAKCKLPTFDKQTQKPTNVPTSVPAEPRRTGSSTLASSTSSMDTERPTFGSEISSPSTPMPQRKLSELAGTGILKVSRDADGRLSYSTEVRLKSRDGSYRWHLVRVLLAEPLLQTAEDEETWYGTCTDINDHKTLERDLKETMDEKSRFLSNMSHEIRTPLNGITGMVNFLIDSNLTPEQMEHVNIIRASTEGLRGLINDILDLSKAEAGMIQLSMDWLYVRALIEEINDLTFAMAIDKGLELNYFVEESVPTQIKADRFRVRQILLNVVGNAIKFTQHGEVFVRCSTVSMDQELDDNELFIKFEVIDTGRGFNDKEAEFLFKRFSQIDGSSTRQHGGSGLGLVISQQLAQLHGGNMSAKGEPGKGSTFTFYVKAALPSSADRPPVPLLTPGVPISVAASPASTPSATFNPFKSQPLPIPQQQGHKPSIPDISTSPGVVALHNLPKVESPSVSSASSDPSIRSVMRTDSMHSGRSSTSSLAPDSLPVSSTQAKHQSQDLARPALLEESSVPLETNQLQRAQKGVMTFAAPLFSILVVCPLKFSREATIQHVENTLPSDVPHHITSREKPQDCLELLRAENGATFSHIVVVLQVVDEIVELMNEVLPRPALSSIAMVIITDLAQRKSIVQQAPNFDYHGLCESRRLSFVFKPLKPSRLAIVFDPQKEREMSLDRNHDSAQQVAVTQKQVFEELSKRLGNKDKRVLLVEDNRVNQMVILKFFAKANIKVETVLDGVQCTDKVFSQPPGHYSIILCDLHMPNKDGYQTCAEIRKWERDNRFPHSPIVALSANVLGDVYQKCVEAGFNSYMTKPVDFKELGTVLTTFMDPNDPTRPHEFMKMKKTNNKKTLRS